MLEAQVNTMNKIGMRKEEERWRAESDMRTLMQAEQIRADPKRLSAAQKMAKDELLKLAPVTGAAADKD